jgi:hypothetical protein
MPAIFDMVFVGELALMVACISQIIKSYPKVPGSIMPVVAGVMGVVLAFLWYLVNGDVLFVDKRLVGWATVYQSFANGIVASVTAIVGYNLQKALPTPNLLPTSTELHHQRMREQVTETAATEVVTTAAISTDVVNEEGNLESETTGIKDDEAVG